MNVIPPPCPLQVYDNTYMSLPALVREDLVTRVLTLQTLLTIIVTPGVRDRRRAGRVGNRMGGQGGGPGRGL